MSAKSVAEQRVETRDAEELVARVRERYGAIAEGTDRGCCGPSVSTPCCGGEGSVSTRLGYASGDLERVPDEANLGLGCGAPIDHLRLQPGETVLDLGSGPGLDVFLAAKRVGPAGRAIGVDMTPAMLERARRAAEKGGYVNVDFREGRLEALPLEDASVDAVTSNCVVNLVPDKAAVFREVARVLKPGGRLVISDIVLDGRLPEAIARDVAAYVGCVSGAVSRDDYFRLVRESGLGEIEVLTDTDSLAVLVQSFPAEARSLLDRVGLRMEDVQGTVRSITFRARRPR